jgi:[protein-PII] uridylyltransferase
MNDVADRPRDILEVFDPAPVAADLAALAEIHRERALRAAVAQRLKAALAESRAAAERLLREDRHGRRCAERLCFMQDQLIRIL